jgi:uncharacterized protein YyaL (SSP411 family)
MANRLAAEQSPYLLQHKDNPVDWYPWGDAAFEKARREDKPIFLSVGYSTCHWCHVMEHESFENAAVAEVLNRYFVSIKVDREERPDVDRVYMTFVQVTTGSGGWPMSVWLTPSLEPFYGGTYFPPTSRWGRPGFVEVLEEIARVWREERGRVEQSASTIVERLRSYGAQGTVEAVPEAGVLETAVREFAEAFDYRRGGFGGGTKFPRPSELLFLLREHRRTASTEPRDMVLTTLRAMALGGMRDHIGGGFHRYSVDPDWRVPHFEKMLYDQAQLVLAYLEAAQVSGDSYFADVAVDTLEYVRRDLMHPEGGFYSAEDADSLPPGANDKPRTTNHEPPTTNHQPSKREGAFYVWTDEEIGEVLGGDANIFRLRYGVVPDGNAPFDPQNEFTHQNLLYTARTIEDVASTTGGSIASVTESLERARARLLEVRSRRPRPHLDDKILTAWNGLMIAAFARAGRLLEDGTAYVAVARRAAEFIRTHLWNAGTSTLLRRFREGQSAVEGYAEDYAYLTSGLIELFEADGNPRWLEWALALARRLDELFWDPVDGGWYSTSGHDPSVLLRLKEEYDGAEPAASSIAVLNLLMLSHLTGDAAMLAKIDDTFRTFGHVMATQGRAVPMMLAALSTYHAGVSQIVVAGDPEATDTRAMAEVLRRRYLPSAVLVRLTPVHREVLARLLPWTAAMDLHGGRATAYVCRDFACKMPVTSPDEFDGQLKEI